MKRSDYNNLINLSILVFIILMIFFNKYNLQHIAQGLLVLIPTVFALIGFIGKYKELNSFIVKRRIYE